ncbi:hypothetical protein FDENT_7194 [Fusarium denticulatum]|uniref:Uncharacterized protein n=1 Tax=Fusarium denticulatum TaxID=48507 RepID=A0A8H5X1F0_9HYPO|nr:hypothetical protein FDENT_7194 [Fusarium denticulatum]
MALQFAIIYILVVGLGLLSGYHNGMFNELVEEVHNMDHWNLDQETDNEDWDSDEEEEEDDEEEDEDDESGIRRRLFFWGSQPADWELRYSHMQQMKHFSKHFSSGNAGPT